MKNSTHDLFETLLLQWLESDSAPESPMEAVAPEFSNFLDVRPEEFTFDSFMYPGEVPDWTWMSIEFNEIFDGQFWFCLPTTWSDLWQEGTAATFADATATRQSIFLMEKSRWQSTLNEFLERERIIAFAYYPLRNPSYHQWVFVIAGKNGSPIWTYAVYSSGDWLIVIKGDASTAADLKDQLASLINSNPWHDWIESAKRAEWAEAVELELWPITSIEDVDSIANAHCQMRVNNHTATALKLDWLPGDGTREYQASVDPGSSQVQATFAGHRWLASREDGTPIGVFIATSHHCIVDVHEPGTPHSMTPEHIAEERIQ